MAGLLLTLLVLWVVLIVLLAAWTLWFQGYIYSEPVGEIYWRGPAAGTALMAFLGLWVFLDYRAPERYHPLQDFSYKEEHRYNELVVPNERGKEEVYRQEKVAGRVVYRHAGKDLRTHPPKIIVVDGDERRVFEPDRDAKGNFKLERGTLHYRDAGGQVMDENNPGVVTTSHFGWLVANLLLNFLLLAVLWACLWLLLRFQWSHALGQAVVFWGVLLLFVLPPILKKAEDVSRERSAAAAQSAYIPRASPRASPRARRLARGFIAVALRAPGGGGGSARSRFGDRNKAPGESSSPGAAVHAARLARVPPGIGPGCRSRTRPGLYSRRPPGSRKGRGFGPEPLRRPQ